MSVPQSYVATRDAQTAVKGREIEILNAIGVPWSAGRVAHIDCPYPGHGISGAGDWRLLKNGRAICTCTGGKTDSILDIVGKVEILDFEASKVRCIEIIERKDLIRQSAGKGGQSTTAAALLNAPAERRDDALPRAYLAHRLGIAPVAVLMPVTRAVGHRALGYFDPPKSDRAKPSKVGDYPCAVFEQVDATGEIHAHRIYLAPGGAGKADLGERDPKKSARKIGDESTAGRAVIWGDAASAPWCVIAEGIETAAAVAHALRAEIESGAAYVAAGISAGGIEAFKPWPATKRVTIAADLDMSRRGEQAARKFGLRNGGVAVSIALPGSAGFGTDWLNVHTSDGTEAVRAGILGAVPYAATADEQADEQRRTDGLDEVARIALEYPVPVISGHVLEYHRVEGEVWLCARRVKGEEVSWTPQCTPVGVAALTSHLGEGGGYGLRIAVQDMGGDRRIIEIAERGALGRMGGAEIRQMLFDQGLRVQDDGDHIVVKLLKAAKPTEVVAVVRSPGWHALDAFEHPIYVTPAGQIFGAPEGHQIELSADARMSPRTARGGTLEGWKEAAAAAVEVTDCPHFSIGLCAAFAGVLVSLTKVDTTGANLSGRSSGGKTTTQKLAVSAWSKPASTLQDSLLQSAKATVNRMEFMAAKANGTILALDEMAFVNGRETQEMIYSFAGGSGKGRLTHDVKARKSHTWSTYVLLSSEKSLEEKVRADKVEFSGGMAARIPDIDVTGINRKVPRATLDKIEAVSRNYGWAGAAFVEALVAEGVHQDPDLVRSDIKAKAIEIAGDGADPAMIRAAESFALLSIAGELAIDFGLLPETLKLDYVIDWAWKRFQGSTDAVALDAPTQAIAALRTWVAERWNSSIQRASPVDLDRLPSRDACGWYDDDCVYIPATRIVEAAGNALKETEIGRSLDHAGLLYKTAGSDRFYIGFVPKIGRLKAYALPRAAFGRQANGNDGDGAKDGPDTTVKLTVHQGGRS